MGINDFIQQQYSFSVDGLTLFIGVVILTLFLLVSVYYIFWLTRKLHKYEHPKFGFLGKPLYSLLIILMSGVGILFVTNKYIGQGEFQVSASKSVKAVITTKILGETAQTKTVKFLAVPSLDGRPWNGNDLFDLIWNISGPQNVDVFEYDRTAKNPSQFVRELRKGTYNIRLIVVYDGETYVFTQKLTL